MHVAMKIEPGIHESKKGWFSTERIKVHNLILGLQLSDEEIQIIKDAGIMGQWFATYDPVGIDTTAESWQGLYAESDGKPYVTYQAVIIVKKKIFPYATIVSARNGMEDFKKGMQHLKAIIEGHGDPSNDTFEM